MKRITAIVIAMAALPAAAQSSCIGDSSYRTCTDASGNSYSTISTGDSSYTSGSNARTGSTWSTSTHRLSEDMSIHSGTDSRGRSWSGTTHTIGDMTIQSGTDSRGNPYSRTCLYGICN